jgi:hypothetical protein
MRSDMRRDARESRKRILDCAAQEPLEEGAWAARPLQNWKVRPGDDTTE